MEENKLFYFTLEKSDGESVPDNFVGTLKAVQKLAQMIANELHQSVYILLNNFYLAGVAFPDEEN